MQMLGSKQESAKPPEVVYENVPKEQPQVDIDGEEIPF